MDKELPLIEDVVTGEDPPSRLPEIESVEGEEVSQYREDGVSEILPALELNFYRATFQVKRLIYTD